MLKGLRKEIPGPVRRGPESLSPANPQQKTAEHPVPDALDAPWFVYIVRCQGGSFYTGITNDIQRRLKMHNAGKASRYTRIRRPVELIYTETCGSRKHALIREYRIKTLSRQEKEDLTAGVH